MYLFLTACIITYAVTYYFAYAYPQYVIAMPSIEIAHFDAWFSVLVVGTIGGGILKAHMNVFEKEHELNLKQREELKNNQNARNAFFANMSHEIRTPINTIIGLNEMIIRESRDEKTKEYAKDIQIASSMLLNQVNDNPLVTLFLFFVVPRSLISVAFMFVCNSIVEIVSASHRKTEQMFLQTVTALSEAVDAKDRYTSGHSKRVAEYSRRIAERMGKTKEEQDEIYRAGLLHDVGKIRVPEDIINKPGKLTEEEYNTIKLHPITGYNILRGISEDSRIAVAAKHHHERYDGKGYPNGLRGEDIPETARILGVADSYDAMASNRSYRNALPQEVVRSEIEKGKGTQFDPVVADVMLKMIDEDKDYRLRERSSSHRRILTVDNEVDNNFEIARIMQDEPRYEVVFAGSAGEALALLTETAYDLILLDAVLPGENITEAVRYIKENYNTPVVLMMGDKTSDEFADFAALGCDDYMTKPVQPFLLKETIHNLTERTNL